MSEIPENFGGRSSDLMADRADSVLGSFDYTDLIEETKHRLRCEELVDDGKGGKTWKKQNAKIPTGKITTDPLTGQYVPEFKTREIPPLLNEYGQQKVLTLLTGVMHRGNALSYTPDDDDGRKNINNSCEQIAETVIKMLVQNVREFGIASSSDIYVIYHVIMQSVESTLWNPLGRGSQNFVAKSLTEHRSTVVRPEEEKLI